MIAGDRGDDLAGKGRGPNLLDLIALGVGYGLAAALIRSFWAGVPALRPQEVVLLVADYCWLGLAMSGPFVLLFTRRGRAEPGGPRWDQWLYTRAESAWLLIGVYWLILTAVVVPSRLSHGVSMNLAILPMGFLAVLWMFRAKADAASMTRRSWTNVAAMVMLLTWPLAWGAMILLTSIWP